MLYNSQCWTLATKTPLLFNKTLFNDSVLFIWKIFFSTFKCSFMNINLAFCPQHNELSDVCICFNQNKKSRNRACRCPNLERELIIVQESKLRQYSYSTSVDISFWGAITNVKQPPNCHVWENPQTNMATSAIITSTCPKGASNGPWTLPHFLQKQHSRHQLHQYATNLQRHAFWMCMASFQKKPE